MHQTQIQFYPAVCCGRNVQTNRERKLISLYNPRHEGMRSCDSLPQQHWICAQSEKVPIKFGIYNKRKSWNYIHIKHAPVPLKAKNGVLRHTEGETNRAWSIFLLLCSLPVWRCYLHRERCDAIYSRSNAQPFHFVFRDFSSQEVNFALQRGGCNVDIPLCFWCRGQIVKRKYK